MGCRILFSEKHYIKTAFHDIKQAFGAFAATDFDGGRVFKAKDNANDKMDRCKAGIEIVEIEKHDIKTAFHDIKQAIDAFAATDFDGIRV